jgi:hypothetical protein
MFCISGRRAVGGQKSNAKTGFDDAPLRKPAASAAVHAYVRAAFTAFAFTIQ